MGRVNTILLISLVFRLLVGQDVPYLSADYGIASAAVLELERTSNMEALGQVLLRSSFHKHQLRALAILASGNTTHIDFLFQALHERNTPLGEGGSQEAGINERVKSELILAISRILDIPQPPDQSPEGISSFLAEAHRRRELDKLPVGKPRTGVQSSPVLESQKVGVTIHTDGFTQITPTENGDRLAGQPPNRVVFLIILGLVILGFTWTILRKK